MYFDRQAEGGRFLKNILVRTQSALQEDQVFGNLVRRHQDLDRKYGLFAQERFRKESRGSRRARKTAPDDRDNGENR